MNRDDFIHALQHMPEEWEDEKQRTAFCQLLADARDEDLAFALTALYRKCEPDWDTYTHFTEGISNEFGFVFVANLLLVTGRRYIPGHYRATPAPPAWKMQRLGEEFSCYAGKSEPTEEQRAKMDELNALYELLRKRKQEQDERRKQQKRKEK